MATLLAPFPRNKDGDDPIFDLLHKEVPETYRSNYSIYREYEQNQLLNFAHSQLDLLSKYLFIFLDKFIYKAILLFNDVNRSEKLIIGGAKAVHLLVPLAYQDQVKSLYYELYYLGNSHINNVLLLLYAQIYRVISFLYHQEDNIPWLCLKILNDIINNFNRVSPYFELLPYNETDFHPPLFGLFKIGDKPFRSDRKTILITLRYRIKTGVVVTNTDQHTELAIGSSTILIRRPSSVSPISADKIYTCALDVVDLNDGRTDHLFASKSVAREYRHCSIPRKIRDSDYHIVLARNNYEHGGYLKHITIGDFYIFTVPIILMNLLNYSVYSNINPERKQANYKKFRHLVRLLETGNINIGPFIDPAYQYRPEISVVPDSSCPDNRLVSDVSNTFYANLHDKKIAFAELIRLLKINHDVNENLVKMVMTGLERNEIILVNERILSKELADYIRNVIERDLANSSEQFSLYVRTSYPAHAAVINKFIYSSRELNDKILRGDTGDPDLRILQECFDMYADRFSSRLPSSFHLYRIGPMITRDKIFSSTIFGVGQRVPLGHIFSTAFSRVMYYYHIFSSNDFTNIVYDIKVDRDKNKGRYLPILYPGYVPSQKEVILHHNCSLLITGIKSKYFLIAEGLMTKRLVHN